MISRGTIQMKGFDFDFAEFFLTQAWEEYRQTLFLFICMFIYVLLRLSTKYDTSKSLLLVIMKALKIHFKLYKLYVFIKWFGRLFLFEIQVNNV